MGRATVVTPGEARGREIRKEGELQSQESLWYLCYALYREKVTSCFSPTMLVPWICLDHQWKAELAVLLAPNKCFKGIFALECLWHAYHWEMNIVNVSVTKVWLNAPISNRSFSFYFIIWFVHVHQATFQEQVCQLPQFFTYEERDKIGVIPSRVISCIIAK